MACCSGVRATSEESIEVGMLGFSCANTEVEANSVHNNVKYSSFIRGRPLEWVRQVTVKLWFEVS